MANNTVRGLIQRDSVMILMTLIRKKKYCLDDYLDMGWGSKTTFFEVIQNIRDAIIDLNLPYFLEINQNNEYSLFVTTESLEIEKFYELSDDTKNKYSLIILMYMFNRKIKMDMSILRNIIPNKSDKTIRRTIESLNIIYESLDIGHHIESKRKGNNYFYSLTKY